MTSHDVNAILMLFCVITFVSHCIVSILIIVVDKLFRFRGKLESEELNIGLTILSSILLADIIIPVLM